MVLLKRLAMPVSQNMGILAILATAKMAKHFLGLEATGLGFCGSWFCKTRIFQTHVLRIQLFPDWGFVHGNLAKPESVLSIQCFPEPGFMHGHLA